MARIKSRGPKAVPPRVEGLASPWPTDAAAFDARLDTLAGAFPEQSDNLRRLRAIVHEASRSPSDPAVQDRFEAEYDVVMELIDETASAPADATVARHGPPALERLRGDENA